MPPKKQPENQSSQYKPCYILPIFLQGPKSPSAQAFIRPVNIKKNIDLPKIIQILKDKGLQQYMKDGQVSQKGRQFICENMKTVCDELIASTMKAPDPKKDAKKDTKKDSKKQEAVVPQTATPPIEIQYEKICTDFIVLLGIPNTAKELEIVLSKNIKIDMIVIVKQKIKPGSRKPNYQLLNNNKSIEQMNETLRNTVIDPDFMKKKQAKTQSHHTNVTQITQFIQSYKEKAQNQNPNKNIVILEIPFLNDLSKPENNQANFIKTFFERVCKCTKEYEQYLQWKGSRKIKPMIQPIKEKITKQVQVEDKDKGKKGGKGLSEPIYETIEEIIEKRYEDFPQNIRSDLQNYTKIKKIKYYDYEKQEQNEDKYSTYKDVLNNILNSFNLKTQSYQNLPQPQTQVQQIADKIRTKYQSLPVNKITNKNILNRLRHVNYVKNMTMNNSLKLNFPPIQSQFSYMQLAQKVYTNKEQLRIEFLIDKLEKLAKSSSSKIRWSFSDRYFIEKFDKQQIQSILNQELLADPQIFTGYLEAEGLKLIILSRTNPPGRVLYHNEIFDWKVVPDFQNWVDNFLKSQQKLKIQQFFDYPYENVGNLAIKVKNMMPSDNTVIRDELYIIGTKKNKIIQLNKNNTKFGLTKRKVNNGKNHIYVYWHDIEDQYRLRVFKTKDYIITEKNPQVSKEENYEQGKSQNIEKISSDLGVIIKNKGKYTVFLNPNPTIHWTKPKTEKIREFGSLGQIISYKSDGSIHIYSPNGNISIFRNGKWSRILNNQYIDNGQKIKMSISELYEGQSLIQIREDQTIFVTDAQKNKKIIFPDGTQINQNVKQRKREIKNPQGPFIRIYLPRDNNLNVIGYGSAFAYLGFKNLRQRSYDGYMFQFIDNQISSHYYTQRYDLNGKLKTEEIRLIAYKDGTILKINNREAKIVYVSPSRNQLLTEEIQNQRWLQTFTTANNHGEGIFDIDLELGQIQNKDAETNKFIAKVNDRSEAHIAVSFITEDQDDSVSNFPSGFHVKEQNYFLPAPVNRIPPRIFTINQDGSGTEYLSSEQITNVNMDNFTVIKQYQGNKNITQYSLEDKPKQSYIKVTFSQSVDLNSFGLPDILKTVETRKSLTPVRFHNIKHRIIQEIPWNSDFSYLRKLQEELREQSRIKKQKRDARRDNNRLQSWADD